MGIDLLAGTVYGTRAMIARPPRILVFDSGIGGLSVLREVRAAMPGAALVYAAGVPWLMGFADISLERALVLGVLPFLVGDVVKAAAAALLLPGAWRLLGTSGR